MPSGAWLFVCSSASVGVGRAEVRTLATVKPEIKRDSYGEVRGEGRVRCERDIY